MKKIALVVLSIMILFVSKPVAANEVDYTVYAQILKEYVNDEGLVNYDLLRGKRHILDEYIEKNLENRDISSFTDSQKKAYWINTYNALTLRLIVDHYPLKLGGIRTINWGRPWNVKLRAAGKPITLHEIEHEILRKWNPIDPRIHFAINCASIGCPKLPNKPFYPDSLDEQLDFETRRFINDQEKVKIDKEKMVLYYSAIFNWFEEDFLAQEESIKAYILKFINVEDQQYIKDNNLKSKALKYDWGLNKQ